MSASRAAFFAAVACLPPCMAALMALLNAVCAAVTRARATVGAGNAGLFAIFTTVFSVKELNGASERRVNARDVLYVGIMLPFFFCF